MAPDDLEALERALRRARLRRNLREKQVPRLQYDLDKIEELTQYAEGTFRARLKSCVAAVSDNSGNPMLVWTWIFLEGPNKAQTTRSWTSKMENALFGIKAHLTAFGYSGKVDMNTDRLIGKEVRLVMAKRKGKNRDGVETDFVSVVGLLPAKRGAREDYDDEYEEEEKFEDEEEEAAPPTRKSASASKNGLVKRRQVVEEDEDEENEEEDDEEPVHRRASVKAVAKKGTAQRSRVEEDDEEEEDEEPVRRTRSTTRPAASARRNGSVTRRREVEDEEDDDEVPF